MKLHHAVSRIVCGLLLLCTAARADDADRSGIQSLGLRFAYGVGNRHQLRFFSLLPRVSLFFPQCIDRALAAHHLQLEYVIEPIASYITNSTDTVEAGVNPLFFALRYDQGQALVPFIEGGEGVLYTDLRGERLGTRFQFSSQGGAGLHWFISRTVAVTAAYRLRHISNAGISRENSGLNTDFFSFGITLYPRR